MSAKTLVTTPNSDVIYAMGYLDLKRDGPMVIEAPPGLQGILDDFFQRPIHMVGQFEGRDWSGDVGLPGPDRGRGGKYLVLPPDYSGDIPTGYFTYRSRRRRVRAAFFSSAYSTSPVMMLVSDRLRHGHYVGSRQWPAVPVAQSDGQAAQQSRGLGNAAEQRVNLAIFLHFPLSIKLAIAGDDAR